MADLNIASISNLTEAQKSEIKKEINNLKNSLGVDVKICNIDLTDENSLVQILEKLDEEDGKKDSVIKESRLDKFGGVIRTSFDKIGKIISDEKTENKSDNALVLEEGKKNKGVVLKEVDGVMKPTVTVVPWAKGDKEEGNDKRNDCLWNIASNYLQYAPEKMTHEEALEALMKANPQIYGDDVKRSGSTSKPRDRWVYDGEPVYLPADWVKSAKEADKTNVDDVNDRTSHNGDDIAKGYPKTVTNEDGSKTVTTKYKDGCTCEKFVNKDGKVTGYKDTTATDNDGNYTVTDFAVNDKGKSIMSRKSIYDEFNKEISKKEYYENGKTAKKTTETKWGADLKSKIETVTEYDTFGKVLHTTVREYDSKGNIAQEKVDGVVTIKDGKNKLVWI